jgi:pimeloyl-ACP methyl ester carboxylesterase
LRGRRSAASLVAALAVAGPAAARPVVPDGPPAAVRILSFPYRAHDGLRRLAWLVLPRRYRPPDRPLPLVISPHGRGTSARANVETWGDLPARGRFALVAPQGQGRRLALDSWGDPGQIADLARMPRLVERAFPWLRIDRRRIYAVGASMGGQETLLLVARYPHLLAGAAAFDPVTDMARRYWGLGRLPGGAALQRLARLEVGGSPLVDPSAYAARSPDRYARAIAMSHVPLQIYWSSRDGVIAGERSAIRGFAVTVDRLNRHAEVLTYRGDWHHCAEMKPRRELARALARLGLLPWRLGFGAGHLRPESRGERVARPGAAAA